MLSVGRPFVSGQLLGHESACAALPWHAATAFFGDGAQARMKSKQLRVRLEPIWRGTLLSPPRGWGGARGGGRSKQEVVSERSPPAASQPAIAPGAPDVGMKQWFVEM